MKKLYFLLFCFTSIISYGQTTNIALDDFEALPSTPNFNFVFTGGAYITGSSAAGDRVANSPFFATGSQAYQLSATAVGTVTTAVLTSANINTSGFNNVTLSFNLAAFSIGNATNGQDQGDSVLVEISPDGGATYLKTLSVRGNNNACWSYTGGTAIATTAYDGDNLPTRFQPAGGTIRTIDGYSTVSITGLPQITNLRVRITLLNDRSDERWVIDNASLTGTAIVTPIFFTSFGAQKQNNGVLIKWAASSTNNDAYFEIQKSGDNQVFSVLSKVPVKGTGQFEYTLQDKNIIQSNVFYRLKLVDANGEANYSQIAAVKFNGKASLYNGLFPSISNSTINLQLFSDNKKTGKAEVIDAAGRNVMTINLSIAEGSRSYPIDINKLQTGIYYIIITVEKESITDTFIRQ